MKICIRGYDIYKNPVISNTRISGLTVYTENLLKYWRKNYPNLKFSFIRSSKTELLKKPRIIDGICVYGINTKIDKETVSKKKKLLVDEVGNSDNPTYAYRAAQFASIINHECPDVVNLHNTRPAVEYIWAKKKGFLKTNFKTILTLHDLFEQPMLFIAKHIEYFDYLVAISGYVLKKIKSYGIADEKIKVINPGVDIADYKQKISLSKNPKAISKLKNKIGINELNKNNSFLILMPSRRVEHKGHLVAFEALQQFCQLSNLKRKPYLFISGKDISVGSKETALYENRLYQFVKKSHLLEKVIFLPKLSSQELCLLYQLVDVVLTPSTQAEGFCFSNIEAMLSRVPVVTSKMGGPLDYIVHNKTGYFVSPGDVQSIFNVLCDIYKNPPNEELLDGAQKKASSFTIKNMAENYLKLYKQVMDGC